ncbi:hypothetical protein SCLCIDRAFT_30108 [Scleroderma citrinum Foug A]|uniref:MATE efflux family protein n=1 Tax=Scleroderma citrinum Foug A TaxID=1036808 RepID=A0A0C3DHD8_9AGAM|nr:hypothetical protein SCLCIDRAFT_30108 [Scleroderma citrinum Foug A]
MSHQRSTLQSRPYDYAILARSQNDRTRHCQDCASSIANDDNEPSHSRGIPVRPVTSMADTSEHTPLIGHSPPIPRIHQITDDDICSEQYSECIPSAQMFYEELNVLTRYSLPVFATYLAEFSFTLTSVVCIGHLSTVALAAGTLGMMTASVTGYAIVQGFASTLDTLLPPAWTSDTPHVPILTLWFNIEPILLLLKQEPEVAHLAGVFLRYAAWGLPAYSFNCIIKRYFQSQGLFAVPARITLIVAPFNAFLNWFFVFPLGLSFRGAPIASAISFNLVALAFVLYGYFFVPRTAWIPIGRDIWQGWGLLGRLGVAGIGQIASAWWTWELTAFAAGLLGSVMLAAQSTLIVSVSLAYQASFATSVAASVRIGNLLGEGKARRAKVGAQVSIVLGAIIGCTWWYGLL